MHHATYHFSRLKHLSVVSACRFIVHHTVSSLTVYHRRTGTLDALSQVPYASGIAWSYRMDPGGLFVQCSVISLNHSECCRRWLCIGAVSCLLFFLKYGGPSVFSSFSLPAFLPP